MANAFMDQHFGQRLPPLPRFARVAEPRWRKLAKKLFDPYRPERYYMRGPGPKWHAKHDCALPERPA